MTLKETGMITMIASIVGSMAVLCWEIFTYPASQANILLGATAVSWLLLACLAGAAIAATGGIIEK